MSAAYDWPLQQALYAALATPLLTGITQVVDHKLIDPPDSVYPYLEIGDGQIIPDDTDIANGAEHYFDLHTWSRALGKRELKQIRGRIFDRLHNTSLTVAGLASCNVFVIDGRTLDDPDGLTRHGIVTVKLLCRES